MKDKPKILTPKLRFPEFKEEWRESPLGTVVKEFQAKSTTQGEYEVLTSARVGLMRQVDYYGEGRITERDNVGFNVIPADYLTYRSRTDDGRFYFNHNDLGITGIVSVYYPVFHSTNGSNTFIAALLNRFSVEIGTHSAGTSQRVLPISKLLRVRLPIPVAAEQRKIAACLTLLDNRLAAEGKKLEALRAHKKGLMQQLFPREGETRPRLRFPEFRNRPAWEERSLGQLGRLVSGLTYSPADVRSEGLLVLRSSNIKGSEIAMDDCVYVAPDIRGANLAQPNDILICVRNGSKPLIGKNALIPEGMPPCTHGAFMTVLRAKAPQFVFQLLQTGAYHKQVAANLGATINSINGSQLLKYRFVAPEQDEQQRIASCLSSLDSLIGAQSRKLDGLRAYKKGLVQHLFPSPGDAGA